MRIKKIAHVLKFYSSFLMKNSHLFCQFKFTLQQRKTFSVIIRIMNFFINTVIFCCVVPSVIGKSNSNDTNLERKGPPIVRICGEVFNVSDYEEARDIKVPYLTKECIPCSLFDMKIYLKGWKFNSVRQLS